MYAMLPSSAAVGAAAARAVTLMVEVVVDVDMAAEAAVGAQVKVDPKTNLRLTKSLGFRPISTTPQRSTQVHCSREGVGSPEPHKVPRNQAQSCCCVVR
jgi:hypothetical protein